MENATFDNLQKLTYVYDSIGNLTTNAGNVYTYGDAAHKHAVTAAFGNSYGYDANGNQTTRTIGGVTYTFTYDYENHLTAVSGGSVSASFVYDADGNRVKGTVNGTTTVYLAGIYEYQGGATTLYYEGNAMRRTGYAANNGVFYLLQDQLKSSSVLANQNGTVNSRNYFYPFGGNRGGAAFSSLTTKRFTGYTYGVYISDLDPAFAIYQGRPLHDDIQYMDRFGQEINDSYGMAVIQHGNFIGAWYRGKPGATTEKLQDTVYLFDANGYTGSGTMWGFYNALGGRNYPPSDVSSTWK